ncbi:MAG: sulfur carrier protein ThiS [Deltaproteobacteria bacterium]|nr:sulfur carrier protein ThiS [Deltaproteobacteria bacterium]
MVLIINGERYVFEEDVSVMEMLEILDVKHSRVAVELNKKIVRKSEFETTLLSNGDMIEVVSFVGGG